MTGSQIFALPVAGGTLALAPLPVGPVLAALLAWRPGLVISLTTQAEMDRLGAGHLPAVLRAADIAWHHLPVADFGTPAGTETPALAQLALAVLGAGGRVLVHCRGGCGRSGMLALRLMIAAGEAAPGALARLRAVRPCAVETAAQMRWAENAPPLFRA